MTVPQSTGCTLIQGFPVLLILAQNNNYCLTTPFMYKPPSPTHSPEYYEALDALYHTLNGHGYHGFDGPHGYDIHHGFDGHHGFDNHHGYESSYPSIYDNKYPVYGHGHSYPEHGHSQKYPEHGHGQKYPEHGHGQKYPEHGHGQKYPEHGHGQKYPVYGHGTKYPQHSTSYKPVYPYPNAHHGYPGMYYKKCNNNKCTTYDTTTKTYAPNHYHVQNKYKVVVKKNKSRNKGRRHNKKSGKLQGFFPQREDRRYGYQSQFGQNFLPDPKRITERLTGVLHLKPENQNSNSAFIFPFRRPGITTENGQPNNQQDQYQQNQYQNNPYQNNPSLNNHFQNNPYQNQGQNPNFGQNPNYGQNQNNEQNPNYGDYNNGNQNGNENPVAFPTSRPLGNEVNFVGNTNFAATNNNENPINPNEDENYNTNGVPNGEPKNNNDAIIFEDGSAGMPPNEVPSVQTSAVPNEQPSVIPSEPLTASPFVPQTSTSASLTDLLAPLTPVPDAEKRNNFNFGPAGIFQETCDTIEGGIGSCISILQCGPYLRVLKDSRTNPQAVQILRQAHCGFEGNNPKVCCPRAGIPTARPTDPPTTTTTTVAPEPAGKTSPGDFVVSFPEPPVCGVSNASFSRVVGGVNAKLGDFPWMALLGYKSRQGTGARWLCGGCLISSKHVLTAAHCIHGRENDLFVVRLGELDLEKEDEGATPVDVLIKDKIKHEQYSSTAFTNDIGILVLERDVEFTNLIKPICIPKNSELRARSFENYNPIIAGWGDTEFRGPRASHLQALQLPVVSNDFCASAYSAYKQQQIDQRVLCAGYKKGGRDACQGDSGGPLMQPIWNAQEYTTHFYQIGVVSYGKKCAEAGFPGVYTRVTHFVPWLEEKVLGQANV